MVRTLNVVVSEHHVSLVKKQKLFKPVVKEGNHLCETTVSLDTDIREKFTEHLNKAV